MDGMSMHGKRQAAGPRRGEYCGPLSRQAWLPIGNNRIKPFADRGHAEACLDGHPQYSPRRPPGGTPLSEGG